MDTYFIQYFAQESWYNFPKFGPFPKWHFRNGFSANYKVLKNYGDFIWLKEGDKIPITKGVVYVSLSYSHIFKDIVESAINNPDLKIIAGGPAFTKYFDYKSHITNLEIVKNIRVEDLFKIEYDEKNWGLEIPLGFENIGYDFSLVKGKGCWWGKCIFCKWSDHLRSEDYKILSYGNIPIINYPGLKCIWLNSASMFPSDIIKIYSNLPVRDDVIYSSYIRGDELTYTALEQVMPEIEKIASQLVFSIGVELPSKKRLDYIKKGTTPECLFKVVDLLSNAGCMINLNFILGWPDLTWAEAFEVVDWLYKLKKTNLCAILYRLMIIEDRPIYKMVRHPISLLKKEGNLKAYIYCLSDEQKEINDFIRRHLRYYLGTSLLDNYNNKEVYNKRNVERN